MLLTIDIGTTSFKTALWDLDGNRLGFTSEELIIEFNDGVKYETNPLQWLKAFGNCCSKLGNFRNLKFVEVIVISGNGPTLVPVLEDGSDLNFNARLWLDRRSVKYQKTISDLMGGFVDACFFLPKILGIKNEEEELYEKTKYFLGCPEYLAYILTGEAHSVFPSEGFDRWFWNENVLKKLDLDNSKFPAFIKPGDKFGFLLSHEAEVYGFTKNIPVVCGGPDFFTAILGAGITEPFQVCDRTGSSEGINLCLDKQIDDSRLMSYGHPVKPWWNLSGVINTSGKAIQWGCDFLGMNCINDFISLAEKSISGSNGLIFSPFLAGERTPVLNTSLRAQWNGISLSSDKCDFANSILEGICFAVKDVINVMEEAVHFTGNKRITQMSVTGGLSDCSYLNQIKADITGLKIIEGMYKEAELSGLAVIGLCFLGKYTSFAEASKELYKVKKIYEPNSKNAELYEQLFNRFKNLKN